MGFLLLIDDSGGSTTPPPEPEVELLPVRFVYDLVYRGELREEDSAFLQTVGASNEQIVKQAKIIRIMEAV
jgi:hypothetical protein